MTHHHYYPPKGITREDVARAYQEAGSMENAAKLLGCSFANVEHHIHRAGVKVRRWNRAYRHVPAPNGGIMRVRLHPDEESRDTLPSPYLKRIP